MTESDSPILFIVPARGGSKGVLRKNLTLLAGQPLIAHVLVAAKLALRAINPLSSRLIVSTDDEEIVRVARQWGAEIPFLRPAEFARDDSPTMDVILHALDALKAQENYEPDTVALLQATSPLVAVEDICNAVRLFGEGEGPVVSVTQNEHPLEWSFSLEGGYLRSATGASVATRRQAARITYRLNGAIYIATPAQLRASRSFLGPETRGYVMPAERSVDVDTMLDFRVAEAILRHQAGSAPRAVIEVAGRKIGPGQPCFIIAEAGVNHNGSLELAHRLIEAAAEAGANAVKFQTFRAEELVTVDAPKAQYQTVTTDAAESQLAMLKRLQLNPESHLELKRHAEECNLIFLSTPFEQASADVLESLNVAAFKIPSGEVSNTPFLAYVARKGKPILLSTGMSRLEEVGEAIRTIREQGNPPLALFHCVSCYPTLPEDCNLWAMETLRCAYRVPVGFSDHTMGLAIPAAAVALGANLLEKHLTLDRSLPGPDHAASLEPAEFGRMVEMVRQVEAALGDSQKLQVPAEEGVAAVIRKSLIAAVDIEAGTPLRPELVEVRRPGTGLAPSRLAEFTGRRIRERVPRGRVLQEEDFA